MPDNWEVEQKFFVHDPMALRRNLIEAGFEHGYSEENCDTYFRHPCRDFRVTDEAFRIRVVGDSSFVTYKGKRLAGAVKTRPEIELPVTHADRGRWQDMLQLLGFEPLPAVRKLRHVFSPTAACCEGDANIQVVLDEVQLLGDFAEIELLVVDAQELGLASRRISSLAEKLRLTDIQPKSYLSQLLDKLGFE